MTDTIDVVETTIELDEDAIVEYEESNDPDRKT